MGWYIAPAIISLLVKLLVIFFARKKLATSKSFIYLIIALAMQNVLELLLFVNFFAGSSADLTLRFYYACTIAVLAYTVSYVIDVADIEVTTRFIRPVLYVTTCIILCVIFTDTIIAGFRPINHAITRVSGSYYWIFQIFTLSVLVFSISLPVVGYCRTDNPRIQIQCLYTFLSLLAPFFTGCSSSSMIAAGKHGNAMILLPLATTVFVLITLTGKSGDHLTDLRRFLPFSLEKKVSREIQQVISAYSQEEHSHASSMNEIERILVQYKHAKSGNNPSKTAKSMDIPRATLYSKFRRLNIDYTNSNK